MNRTWKQSGAFLLVLALCFGLAAGCAAKVASSETAPAGDRDFSADSFEGGSANLNDWKADADGPIDSPEEAPSEPGALAPEQTDAQSARKIIRNAEFSMETLDYDKTIQQIQELIQASGGYVENSQTSGAGAADDYYRARWASFTLRVPAQGLDDFANSLAQCGSVTDSRFYTEEVTEYYYDTEAHLKSLRLQEERLLEILSKAETLTDVVALENSLADVRYRIESLQGSLRRLDSLIALSTVTISVQEVYEYTPDQGRAKSLGQRISAEFQGSVAAVRRTAEDILVFVLGNILIIALWALVLIFAAALFLRLRRRRKPPAPPEKDEGPGPDETQK